MSEIGSRKRNRTKQALPLKIRLERAARASREAAKTAQSAAEREALLGAARRYEVAANLDDWLSLPGSQASS
jgi:hypothetical protein